MASEGSWKVYGLWKEYGKTEYGTQYGHQSRVLSEGNRKQKSERKKLWLNASIKQHKQNNSTFERQKNTRESSIALDTKNIARLRPAPQIKSTPVLSDLDESIKKFQLITINENSSGFDRIVIKSYESKFFFLF